MSLHSIPNEIPALNLRDDIKRGIVACIRSNDGRWKVRISRSTGKIWVQNQYQDRWVDFRNDSILSWSRYYPQYANIPFDISMVELVP